MELDFLIKNRYIFFSIWQKIPSRGDAKCDKEKRKAY